MEPLDKARVRCSSPAGLGRSVSMSSEVFGSAAVTCACSAATSGLASRYPTSAGLRSAPGLRWSASTCGPLAGRRPVIQVPMAGTRAIRAGDLLVKEPAGKPGAHTWEQFLAEKLSRTLTGTRP